MRQVSAQHFVFDMKGNIAPSMYSTNCTNGTNHILDLSMS